MVYVNEDSEVGVHEMQYVEFLEFIGRVADYVSFSKIAENMIQEVKDRQA
jgi:hypothetical protein